MSKTTSPHPNPFEEKAFSWWETEGPFWTLHKLNPIRLNLITQNITLADSMGLDIGCGGGLLTEKLHQAGADISGIDTSKNAILVAKAHAKKHGYSIPYHQISAEAFLEHEQKSFDFITCFELLEHVDQPDSLLKLCAQKLKPGG